MTARASIPAIGPAFTASALFLLLLIDPGRAAGADRFLIAPYLQHLTHHSVNIRFETAHASTASVEVTPEPQGAPLRVVTKQRLRFHDLRVEGLTTATAYRYVVHAGDTSTEPVRFTTPPEDPTQPFSFVVYGDSRSNPKAHAQVAHSIEALSFDFLVQTGDLVQHGSNLPQWRQFFALESTLLASRPVFVSMGNHDLDGRWPRKRDTFLTYFGASPAESARPYFTVRWGNTRLFVLDTTDAWDGAQGRWLRGELDRARGEAGLVHRMVVMHHGPYSSGSHGGNQAFADAGLVNQLRSAGVELVVAGHDHLYERGEHEGIKYIVSGGAGAPLYPKRAAAPGSAFVDSVHHVVHIRVNGDRVAMAARRADGSLLEACTFRSGAPWQCEAGEARSEAANAPGPAAQQQRAARAGAWGCGLPGRGTLGLAGLAGGILVLAALLLRRTSGGAS